MTTSGTTDLWSDDDEAAVEQTVRPYTVTGGRTRPSSGGPAFEALVSALAQPEIGMTPERRRILELTAEGFLSIAELSAHVHLPIGVVRVVVSDLAAERQVKVHSPSTTTSPEPATTISVLESVLNGISSL